MNIIITIILRLNREALFCRMSFVIFLVFSDTSSGKRESP